MYKVVTFMLTFVQRWLALGVCVCACVCVRACVRVRMWVHARTRVCTHMRVWVRVHARACVCKFQDQVQFQVCMHVFMSCTVWICSTYVIVM